MHHDSVYSFDHNAQRGPKFGFLKLRVQVYVQGKDIRYEPVTRPGERLSVIPYSLLDEALLEATLLFHDWKNLLMAGRADASPAVDLVRHMPGLSNEFSDVWDLMEAGWVPEYTDENYDHFIPLFKVGIEQLRTGIDRLLTVFGHVLPSDYQAELVRGSRRLASEGEAYWMVRYFGLGLGRGNRSPENEAHAFRLRFTEVIRVLRHLDREADRRRDLLKRPKRERE
jgi:hypothetical protein